MLPEVGGLEYVVIAIVALIVVGPKDLPVMLREALSPGRELVRVVPATLGPDAGVVGAGFVGFEALDNA